MIYRIFKYHSHSGAYVLQETGWGGNNLEWAGNYVAAAVEWARRLAPSTAEELDLLVAELGNYSIIRLRRVYLKRVPSPQWKHVMPPDLDFEEGEID